jgi:predicted AAA+ superfamily ATPase
MNDGQLRRRLAEHCPWWTNPQGWEADDPDLRDTLASPFAHKPEPLVDIAPPGLYVLRGPRRVGKSVELKRAISRLNRQGVNPRAIFFVNGDGLSSVQDLRRIVVVGHNDIPRIEGPRYWFIDEVTAISGWSGIVKDLRDQNTPFREGCVVLSGSSARDLREATADLADRRGGAADSDRLLLPMTFRRFCSAVGTLGEPPDTTLRPRDFLTRQSEDALHELHPWWSQLDDQWQLFLQVGGFPRAVGEFLRFGSVQPGFLNGVADVIRGDAFRTTTMSETQAAAFLDRLVQGLASPINASEVARDTGLSDNEAVERRIDSLVLAFYAWRCYRVRGSLPNPEAQRKLYFIDPLIARLAHLRDRRYIDPDPSVLTEQQIGLALTRAIAAEAPDVLVQASSVMYQRTETDAEIDFVGPRLDLAFECKYIDRPWRSAARTVRASRGRGVLVTRSVFDLEAGPTAKKPVWAIPAGMVAWLLDTSWETHRRTPLAGDRGASA